LSIVGRIVEPPLGLPSFLDSHRSSGSRLLINLSAFRAALEPLLKRIRSPRVYVSLSLAAGIGAYWLGVGPIWSIYSGILAYFILRMMAEGPVVVLMCLGVISIMGHVMEVFTIATEAVVNPNVAWSTIFTLLLTGSHVGLQAFYIDMALLGTAAGLSWLRFAGWVFAYLLIARIPANLPELLNDFGRFNYKLRNPLSYAVVAATLTSVVVDVIAVPGGILNAGVAGLAGFFISFVATNRISDGILGLRKAVGLPVKVVPKVTVPAPHRGPAPIPPVVGISIDVPRSGEEVVAIKTSALAEAPSVVEQNFAIAIRVAEIALAGRSRAAIAKVREALSMAGEAAPDLLAHVPSHQAIHTFAAFIADGLSDDEIAARVSSMHVRQMPGPPPAPVGDQKLLETAALDLARRVGMSPDGDEDEIVEDDDASDGDEADDEEGDDEVSFEDGDEDADEADGDDAGEHRGPVDHEDDEESPDDEDETVDGDGDDEADAAPPGEAEDDLSTGAVVSAAFFGPDERRKLDPLFDTRRQAAEADADDGEPDADDGQDDAVGTDQQDPETDPMLSEAGAPTLAPVLQFDALLNAPFDDDEGHRGADQREAAPALSGASAFDRHADPPWRDQVPTSPHSRPVASAPASIPESPAMSTSSSEIDHGAGPALKAFTKVAAQHPFLHLMSEEIVTEALAIAAATDDLEPALNDLLAWLVEVPLDDGEADDRNALINRLFRTCYLTIKARGATGEFDGALKVAVVGEIISLAERGRIPVDTQAMIAKAIILYMRDYRVSLREAFRQFSHKPTRDVAFALSPAFEEVVDAFKTAASLTPEMSEFNAMLDQLVAETNRDQFDGAPIESSVASLTRQMLAAKLPAEIRTNLDMFESIGTAHQALEQAVVYQSAVKSVTREESRLAVYSDACIGAMRAIADQIRTAAKSEPRLRQLPLPPQTSENDDVARVLHAYMPSAVDIYLRAAQSPVDDPIELLEQLRKDYRELEARCKALEAGRANADEMLFKAASRGFGDVLTTFTTTPMGQDPARFPLLNPFLLASGGRAFSYETRFQAGIRRTLIVPFDGGGCTFRLVIDKENRPSMVAEGDFWRAIDLVDLIHSLKDDLRSGGFHDMKILLVGGDIAQDCGVLRAEALTQDDVWDNFDTVARPAFFRGLVLTPSNLKASSHALALRSGAAFVVADLYRS
jgi:hypothetical protein